MGAGASAKKRGADGKSKGVVPEKGDKKKAGVPSSKGSAVVGTPGDADRGQKVDFVGVTLPLAVEPPLNTCTLHSHVLLYALLYVCNLLARIGCMFVTHRDASESKQVACTSALYINGSCFCKLFQENGPNSRVSG